MEGGREGEGMRGGWGGGGETVVSDGGGPGDGFLVVSGVKMAAATKGRVNVGFPRTTAPWRRDARHMRPRGGAPCNAVISDISAIRRLSEASGGIANRE